MRLQGAAALAAAILVLTGCATGTPGAAKHPTAPPTVASYRQASARYVAIVLPLNKAIANEDAAAEDDWREFVYYAPATRDEYLAAVKQLGKPESWPKSAREAVRKLEAALRSSATVLDEVSRATSEAQVVSIDKRDDTPIAQREDAAATIYRVLGITNQNAQVY